MPRFRILAGYLLAILLIASGSVRAARKRALAGGVVTALYFHKPDAALFARCIRAMVRYGYVFISADELLEMLEGKKPIPKGATWLSFDDGCREILDSVIPVVDAARIPVTLFIPSGIIAGDGRFPWVDADQRPGGPASRDAITLAELQRLAGNSMVTIGGHTVNHVKTTGCTDEQLRRELEESRRQLECWTGRPVRFFAFPNGEFDSRDLEILRECGYRFAATTENAFVAPGIHPYRVPRFSVADNISFAEALCNLTGVWRPVILRVKTLLKHAPGQGNLPQDRHVRTGHHASA